MIYELYSLDDEAVVATVDDAPPFNLTFDDAIKEKDKEFLKEIFTQPHTTREAGWTGSRNPTTVLREIQPTETDFFLVLTSDLPLRGFVAQRPIGSE